MLLVAAELCVNAFGVRFNSCWWGKLWWFYHVVFLWRTAATLAKSTDTQTFHSLPGDFFTYWWNVCLSPRLGSGHHQAYHFSRRAQDWSVGWGQHRQHLEGGPGGAGIPPQKRADPPVSGFSGSLIPQLHSTPLIFNPVKMHNWAVVVDINIFYDTLSRHWYYGLSEVRSAGSDSIELYQFKMVIFSFFSFL